MSDSRPKIAYRNAQRAYNAHREAAKALAMAAPADKDVAMAVEIRARSHMEKAAKSYRDLRHRQEKVLDTLIL